MSIDIRPIGPEELEAFAAAEAVGFGHEVRPDQIEYLRDLCELDRTLAAFDQGEIVATTGAYSLSLTVPGGALPTAGVDWVAVKPTHRRQGIVTDIMRRQLIDVHERGEPLAGLWASESIIYGRFGYGMATEGVHIRIDRARTALADAEPACGRSRLVSREEALSSWPAVYDRVLPVQPGMVVRTEQWWKDNVLRDVDMPRGGYSARFYVQYEEDGGPQGYACYRIKRERESGFQEGTLWVQELMAATDAAYAALWQYLFGVDLIATIEAWSRPVDEPLLWMLADPRRLVRRPSDSLWVRIVDVTSALEGRRYASSGRVILDVRDQLCPWNEGRYELEAGPDGARCLPSDAEPDVVLSAADLGAVYLGGARLQTLRRAGRVQGDWEKLRQADAMFSWHPLPWCPEVI